MGGRRSHRPGGRSTISLLVALIVAWIVVWTADRLDSAAWFQFFLFTTIAYILSRGIAKASRVLEH